MSSASSRMATLRPPRAGFERQMLDQLADQLDRQFELVFRTCGQSQIRMRVGIDLDATWAFSAGDQFVALGLAQKGPSQFAGQRVLANSGRADEEICVPQPAFPPGGSRTNERWPRGLGCGASSWMELFPKLRDALAHDGTKLLLKRLNVWRGVDDSKSSESALASARNPCRTCSRYSTPRDSMRSASRPRRAIASSTGRSRIKVRSGVIHRRKSGRLAKFRRGQPASVALIDDIRGDEAIADDYSARFEIRVESLSQPTRHGWP